MAATVSAKMVRELCTAPEAALVRASRDRSVRDVSITDLRAKRERARNLRDKFRDLAERQRRESRGKQSPRGATASKSNDRTVMKQQIFAEALANFDKRITAVEAHGGGASTGKSARKSAAGSTSRSTGKTAGKRGTSSKELAMRSDRQAMRKKLQIETTTGTGGTARPLAKRAGKGSAAAAPSVEGGGGKGTKVTGAASKAPASKPPASESAGAKPDRARKSEMSAPAAVPPAANTPANLLENPSANGGVLKKKTVARHSILGKTTSEVSTQVTSIPFDTESVVRAGELDPMALRNPEVAARSSHLVLDRSARIERTGAVKIQAHIGSRNRRNQAKRDSAG